MTAITSELHKKINEALGMNFAVTKMPQNVIFFESMLFDGHNFYLHCTFLTEDEIRGVAVMLKEVFGSFPMNPKITATPMYLNFDTNVSGEFVRTVLAMQRSALHKFLLLTSGVHLLWKLSSDRIIALAQAKQEVCSTPEFMAQSTTLFRNLKQLYILPGVSPQAVNYGNYPAINYLGTSAVENTAKLMAFIANNSKISFSEYLKLDFADSIETQNILPFFGEIDSIQRLLQSRYKPMAESMIASDLSALSSFITKSVEKGNFPERILRNRAAALASASFSPDEAILTSVFSFLSDEERSSLESLEFVDDLDSLVRNNTIGTDTPLIVYAALAEILAAKGLHKAFEVAGAMKHLQSAKEFDLRLYEATIALMDEALNPENDELPFSWSAQMSEHAWVFTSLHSEESKLSLSL
jgi:hypothetical protein